MFITKKKKIQKYLEQKTESDKTTFDFLLCDYLDGTLKTDLESLDIIQPINMNLIFCYSK